MFPALFLAAASAYAGYRGSKNANESMQAMNAQNMAFNAQEAHNQRVWSAEQAALTRNFDENMASTVYRRAMADAGAAGLNPMIVASQGGAPAPTAPTPSGSTASNSGVPGLSNEMLAAVNAASAFQSVMNLEKQGENIDADTLLKRSQAERETASAGQLQQSTQNLYHQTRKLEAEIANIAEDTTNKVTQRALYDAQENLARISAMLESERIGVAEAEAELKKVAKALGMQELLINAPLEKFSSTDMGEANPAVKMILQILQGALAYRRGFQN